MHSVFAYTDYRKFLTDFYQRKKTRKHQLFSYQTFAERAGFKSKSYLCEIMSGKKALLRNRIIFGIANAMGLSKREIAYFEALVRFNEARTLKEREYYFSQLQALGSKHAAVALRQEQFSYFADWYNVIMRELVAMKDFGEDYETLGRTVSPPITALQAQEAVALLISLGLVRKNAKGRYEQTDKLLTTGEYVDRLCIHKFQKATMKLASDAIDRHPKEDRDISSLTLGLSRKGFERVREELKDFRKYMAEIAASDDPAERVYQMNFQLFPASATVSTKSRDQK